MTTNRRLVALSLMAASIVAFVESPKADIDQEPSPMSSSKRTVVGSGVFGGRVLYGQNVGKQLASGGGNNKTTQHRYSGKREAERAAKRLAQQAARDAVASAKDTLDRGWGRVAEGITPASMDRLKQHVSESWDWPLAPSGMPSPPLTVFDEVGDALEGANRRLDAAVIPTARIDGLALSPAGERFLRAPEEACTGAADCPVPGHTHTAGNYGAG